MKKLYNDIGKIVKELKITKENNICKLFEEAGEIAAECNKEFAIKSGKFSKSNLTGELADNIQIILAIANQYQIPYNDIIEAIKKKNIKWQTKYKNRTKK